jgi:CubicO group peptidase (beta-lactamase class C family)
LASEKLTAAPGEQLAYSNIVYEVLGLLVTTIAGQPFKECITQHNSAPAGYASQHFLKGVKELVYTTTSDEGKECDALFGTCD